MSKISIFILLICLSGAAMAQVEHNYLIGPQNTDCDSLDLNGLSNDEVLEAIEKTVFRFDQHFKLYRTSGVRGAHFYSCDGEMGFLVITYDQKKYIYRDVPKSTWDEFITNSDPDGFYLDRIREKFTKLL